MAKRLNAQHLRLLQATTEVRERLRNLTMVTDRVPVQLLRPLIDLLTAAIKARSARKPQARKAVD
jgi:hypothetical protein